MTEPCPFCVEARTEAAKQVGEFEEDNPGDHRKKVQNR